MKRSILIIFILIFCVGFYQVFAQEEQKTSVAILDFEGTGISSNEAKILTDRFSSELVKTRAFIVRERAQMQEIFQEQGLQQTGCTTSECLVEVGKILNVQKMVGGSIGFFAGIAASKIYAGDHQYHYCPDPVVHNSSIWRTSCHNS